MKMEYAWAMPNKDTFSCNPIGAFVSHYAQKSEVIIDPFARNSKLATHTNDLNPNTEAQYHLYAKDFLALMVEKDVQADLIIFDPPYSLRQAKEVYEAFGSWEFSDTQNVGGWYEEKLLCNELLKPGGIFLHFGWHTNGLGKKHGAEKIHLLVVGHGRAHNDTLCLAERVVQVGLL